MRIHKLYYGLALAAVVSLSHAGFYVDDEPAGPTKSAQAKPTAREVQVPAVAPRGQLAGAIRSTEDQTEWVSEKGQTLKHALIAWADRAGWDLQWDVVDGDDEIDYPLPGTLRANGSLDRAVGKIVRLYIKAEVPLKADISVKDRFIRITAAGKNR